MFKIIAAIVFVTMVSVPSFAQYTPEQNIDSLKNAIMQLDQKVNLVQYNLMKSHSKLKNGILIATLGYSVTIAGGLMLGGENNDLGTALLYTGGGIGLAGGFLIFDSFRFYKKAGNVKTNPNSSP